MATFNLSSITIPAKGTATPGKDSYNQEMFFGCLLDILAHAKTIGFALNDQDLATITTAIQGISVNVSGTDLTNLIAKLDELKQSLLTFSNSVLVIAELINEP